jgi:ABC-type polysaccharide/polyol phosphate export permease
MLFKIPMLRVGKTNKWMELKRYWDLLEVLVQRNIKIRYRGSLLGVYWSLLNPLTMTCLYTAVFGAAFKDHYGSVLNYILAVFTGLIVFNFFSSSTLQALGSVVSNGSLLNKVNLPKSIFPVSTLAANIFQFLVGALPLLCIVTLVQTHSIIKVLAIFFPFIALVLFCMGIGFFTSALYVFFRDLSYFYELVLFIVWIACPVFYPAEIVPENIRPLLLLNPLSLIIESFRQISLTQNLPDFILISKSILGGIITLGLGWFFFQWSRPKFMDLL